jgi:hypothetical protein
MRVRISCKHYMPQNKNFRKKSYQELHVYRHHVKLQAGILVLWILEVTDTCWLPSIFCSFVLALLVSPQKKKQFMIRLSFSVNMFGREWKSAIIHNFFPPLMTIASSWILLNVANPLILKNEIWASWWGYSQVLVQSAPMHLCWQEASETADKTIQGKHITTNQLVSMLRKF